MKTQFNFPKTSLSDYSLTILFATSHSVSNLYASYLNSMFRQFLLNDWKFGIDSHEIKILDCPSNRFSVRDVFHNIV